MTRCRFRGFGAEFRPALVALLAGAVAGFGCKTDNYAQQSPLPHVNTMPPTPPASGAESAPVAVAGVAANGNSVGELLSTFCLNVAAHGAPSFACLPLVTYDLRKSGPWVSELGVRLADDVATRLREAGFKGSVLSVPELDARMARSGVAKSHFASIADVVQSGPLLGVDVIAFGTLKSEHSQGESGRELVTLDLSALELASGRVVARSVIEVPSDRSENSTFFDLAQRESLWLPGSP